mmetsp:Transcript_9292/g.18509  ORF Transcript_9292/g.18509 Transcript_9292/m.18509 type:complete len:85 (-) Transcript_9292:666-920(-)
MPNETTRTTCATAAVSRATTHGSHSCEIEVTFPTDLQAEQALQILRVDQEPTDRVSKSFQLVQTKETDEDDKKGGNETVYKLKV